MKSYILAAALSAVATFAQAEPRISQSFDADNGVFVPNISSNVGELGPTASVSADIVLHVKINIASKAVQSSSDKIYCQLALSHTAMSASGPAMFSEAATSAASRSGSTATCSVRIPFLWNRADTTAKITPMLTISVGQTRYLMHSLPETAVPANFKTTTLNYTARL